MWMPLTKTKKIIQKCIPFKLRQDRISAVALVLTETYITLYLIQQKQSLPYLFLTEKNSTEKLLAKEENYGVVYNKLSIGTKICS